MLYPLVAPEPKTYVGIDVAKKAHVAGFVSKALLKKRRFDACPTFSFANNRDGFSSLIQEMQRYCSIDRIAVVMERTGHYHRALRDFLLEHSITVYEIHAVHQMNTNKTDKLDSLSLANALYNQVELEVQTHDTRLHAHLVYPQDDDAVSLRGLLNRRDDLIRERTQRKNRLISIMDEAFPEFTQIFSDPCGLVALNIRERFNTAEDIANADIEDLKACRGKGYRPGVKQLEKLQELARTTIGAKGVRCRNLALEKQQLIAEFHMLEKHVDQLTTEIDKILAKNRAAQILLSMPGIGNVHAAMIIGAIGNIRNFKSASKLRGYFGWAPKRNQTGTSKDSSVLNKSGLKSMKVAMYMIAWRVVGQDTEWRELYERLVKEKCVYDMRKKDYKGKNKVIGRIIGQMINMIYIFLKRDADTVANTAEGADVPAPVLYDRDVHKKHRHYGSRQIQDRVGII